MAWHEGGQSGHAAALAEPRATGLDLEKDVKKA
jgi:hypothetical protein